MTILNIAGKVYMSMPILDAYRTYLGLPIWVLKWVAFYYTVYRNVYVFIR